MFNIILLFPYKLEMPGSSLAILDIPSTLATLALLAAKADCVLVRRKLLEGSEPACRIECTYKHIIIYYFILLKYLIYINTTK